MWGKFIDFSIEMSKEQPRRTTRKRRFTDFDSECECPELRIDQVLDLVKNYVRREYLPKKGFLKTQLSEASHALRSQAISSEEDALLVPQLIQAAIKKR